MRRATIALAVLLMFVGLSACTKQQVISGGNNVAPSLIVEQFMRAANAKDLARMGQLFGTRDGPISSRDSKQDVDKRMFTISTILRHDDFEILSEQIVPGRPNEATQFTVKVTLQEKSHNVPFTMVRTKDDRWLVEQIGLEVITAPR